MLTLRRINREIAKRNICAELVKGKGYFYLIGPDVEFAESTSIYVYRLNQISLTSWMTDILEIANQSRYRHNLSELYKSRYSKLYGE